jgi:hypothetical protein
VTATSAVPARRRPTTWLALALLALALGMAAFMLSTLIVPGWSGLVGRSGSMEEALTLLAFIVAFVSLPVAGVVLAILRPRNPIGWLQLVSGIGFTFIGFAPVYVAASVDLGLELVGYRLVDWVTPFMQNLAWILVVFYIPLLFPDGRLPGPRWKPFALVVTGLVALMLATLLVVDRPDMGRNLPLPLELEGSLAAAGNLSYDVLGPVPGFGVALALAAVIVRYRRSRGMERQQMKWFLAAVALLLTATLLATLTTALWGVFAFLVSLAFLPVAIGIAVLRYRLYDIDRLISRTIGWALVTGVLAAVFVGVVLALQALLAGFTQGETLAVAASTLAALALFQPLRRRIQVAVDRRFDRTRHDGQQLVGAFGERLRDETDLEIIRAEVPATVDAAVRPATVGLWLRERQGAGQ